MFAAALLDDRHALEEKNGTGKCHFLDRIQVGAGELRLVDSLQPAPGFRVMVVAWRGGQVLVGVNGTGTPAVLDRLDADLPGDVP